MCVTVQPEGLKEMYGLINFYKENAKILKDTFQQMGFSVYGACGGCLLLSLPLFVSPGTLVLCSWDERPLARVQ